MKFNKENFYDYKCLESFKCKNFDQYTELYDFAGVSVFKIVVQ